ncbi:MGMT family protein [uncultured Agrococcus sp.]|uniref:MGMT family protein n=1 Tax=uncultured Agrococcus sp. TaxID=382258 RepID=UPI0025DBF755|nr:MGMT family protein [uncultured Agrococcus sp.]
MSRAQQDRELLVEHVLRCVEQVPAGRVVAYGVIGRVVGLGPRQVGQLMSRWARDVPWWRVTNAAGELPPPLLERAQQHWREEGVLLRPDGRGCRYRVYGVDEDALAADYAAAVADLPPLAR